VSRPSEDDREAIDRAFADLVAGYHLTADRPDPLPPLRTEPEPVVEAPDKTWADDHPLFHFELPVPSEPEPEPAEERFQPEAPPPLPRPALPVLIAWIGIGYAALIVLGASFGVPLPTWAGWLALIGFVGGFAVLIARLPRHRPPDAGDGAVL
jgi:hypothetical protein